MQNMEDYLTDLQSNLFAMMGRLMDVKDEKLENEIKRQLAFNELAKTAVANGALMAKCADTLYGLPVSDKVHLIPPCPAEKPVIVNGKRQSLLAIPQADRAVRK